MANYILRSRRQICTRMATSSMRTPRSVKSLAGAGHSSGRYQLRSASGTLNPGSRIESPKEASYDKVSATQDADDDDIGTIASVVSDKEPLEDVLMDSEFEGELGDSDDEAKKEGCSESRSAKEGIQKALDEIRKELEANARKNTVRQYRPRQREFLEYWAKKSGYLNAIKRLPEAQQEKELVKRVLVTENITAAFLKTEVVGRRYRSETGRASKAIGKGKRQSSANKRNVAKKNIVGLETVKAYLSAICDLARKQKRLHRSSCGPVVDPRRETSVEDVMTIAAERQQGKKPALAVNGYNSVAEFRIICEEGLIRNTATGMRDRLMNILSHYGVLRGEDVRPVKLGDLSLGNFKSRDNTCDMLSIVLGKGKTRVSGRPESMFAIRGKEWELCAFDALGLWLLFRLDMPEVSDKLHIDLAMYQGKEQWQKLCLFPGQESLFHPLSATAHGEASERLLRKTGIKTDGRRTHVFRASAYMLLEALGASDAGLRQAGRWRDSVREVYYQTGYSGEAVCLLAGWPVGGGGDSFEPRRAAVSDAPQSLQRLIFPFVEQLIKKRNLSDDLRSFLQLLITLRPVILQDCALLKQKYPDHLLLRHRLFSSTEFASFSKKVVDAEASARDEQRQAPSRGPATGQIAVSTMSVKGLHEQDERGWMSHFVQSTVSLVGWGRK